PAAGVVHRMQQIKSGSDCQRRSRAGPSAGSGRSKVEGERAKTPPGVYLLPSTFHLLPSTSLLDYRALGGLFAGDLGAAFELAVAAAELAEPDLAEGRHREEVGRQLGVHLGPFVVH